MQEQGMSKEKVREELLKCKRKKKKQRAFFIFTMIVIPVIQFLIFYVYINSSSFIMAFRRKNLFLNQEVWAGLDNFRRVWKELFFQGQMGQLTRAIINSILYFLFQEIIMAPLMIILAFFFWKRMPGYKIFRFTFLLPSLIPGIVLPMLYAFMLDSTVGVLTPLFEFLGLESLVPINGWLGTYVTAQTMIMFFMFWSGCGVSIMIMSGNINRLPSEVFESARIDGIKLFQELWHLVIPMIMPLLSIMIVTGTATVFNIYLPPMLITKGGPGGTTRTIAYVIMEWTTQGEENLSAAAGLLFSLVGIPLVFGLKYTLEKVTPKVEW